MTFSKTHVTRLLSPLKANPAQPGYAPFEGLFVYHTAMTLGLIPIAQCSLHHYALGDATSLFYKLVRHICRMPRS